MTVPNVDVVRYSINYGRDEGSEVRKISPSALKLMLSFNDSSKFICRESGAWEVS